MRVRTGRLEFLVPHILRSQLLRPRFVEMSLRLGFAQQMPPWAKLQFLNAGVAKEDLDRVLGRISSLTAWADEWETLAQAHEESAQTAMAHGDTAEAARRDLSASAAFNFAQYVVFMDTARKRRLHDACVSAYRRAAPYFDPPAVPVDIVFRRTPMRGYLRVPPGPRPVPVLVIFNGTNAVKEELHWWTESVLQRGIATLTFDGPGLGQTFHRLSMVAEPRPVGTAILDAIEARPELDPGAVAFLGMSLGGYLAIRMAAHDRRVRAVAAVSPPYSADIYWNITLSGLRRELAALYDIEEAEMGKVIHRITLDGHLPRLKCPLIVSGGGHDIITPGTEAWRIFEEARCDRELVYYPKGAHDCFNVLADLRPRMVRWVERQLEPYRKTAARPAAASLESVPEYPAAAEAVDPDFADALCGEAAPRQWNPSESLGMPVRFQWPWKQAVLSRIEVVHRMGAAVL